MARRQRLGWLAALAILVTSRAFAQVNVQEERLGPLALVYSHVNTDNVERVVDGNRGYYDTLGVIINYAKVGERLDAGVNGHAQYRTYSLDELENESLGDLRAFADFSIVPERLTWFIEDSYGQGAADPFAFEGPGNRESVNVLQTGPELTLPFGQRMGMVLGSRYSDRRYGESTQLDNEALRSEATLFRQTSLTAQVSVSLIDSNIDYRGDLPGYEIETWQLGYTKELASGNVSAQVGRNRIIADAIENSGPLYGIEWRRNVTTRSQIGFNASRAFTDTGELFGLVTGQVAADRPLGILLTSNPLQRSQVGFDYGYTGDRTTITLSVAEGRERYEVDSALDNDNTNTTVELLRRLNPRWNLGFSFVALDRDFVVNSAEADDRLWSVWVDRRLGARFLLGFAARHSELSGTTEAEERLYSMQLIYTPRRT